MRKPHNLNTGTTKTALSSHARPCLPAVDLTCQAALDDAYYCAISLQMSPKTVFSVADAARTPELLLEDIAAQLQCATGLEMRLCVAFAFERIVETLWHDAMAAQGTHEVHRLLRHAMNVATYFANGIPQDLAPTTGAAGALPAQLS